MARSRASCSRRRSSCCCRPYSSPGSGDGLPTITLVGHGTPDWDFSTPIAGAALARWLEGERDAALVPAQRPSEELLARVRGVRCVVASPLRRSIESARLVEIGRASCRERRGDL